MAFSLADSRVVPGSGDPLVTNPTPGVLWLFRGRARGTGTTVWSVNAATNQFVGTSPNRLPPSYVRSASDLYIVQMFLDASRYRLHLSSSVTIDYSSDNPIWRERRGPDVRFTAAAEAAGIGLAVIAADRSFEHRANIGEAYIQYGQYNVSPSSVSPPTDNAARLRILGASSVVTVVADLSHPNIDWPNLRVGTLRSAPDANLGNDLWLRGATEGALNMRLNTANPPTSTNEVVGGGYGRATITGPAEWALSNTEDARRRLGNAVALAWGTRATSVWTTARVVSLWMGNTLLWWNDIQELTLRTGQEARAEIDDIGIETPNIRA